MPSNWRSPPRPGEKSPEQGRPYNRQNREVGRRREGGGSVRSSEPHAGGKDETPGMEAFRASTTAKIAATAVGCANLISDETLRSRSRNRRRLRGRRPRKRNLAPLVLLHAQRPLFERLRRPRQNLPPERSGEALHAHCRTSLRRSSWPAFSRVLDPAREAAAFSLKMTYALCGCISMTTRIQARNPRVRANTLGKFPQAFRTRSQALRLDRPDLCGIFTHVVSRIGTGTPCSKGLP